MIKAVRRIIIIHLRRRRRHLRRKPLPPPPSRSASSSAIWKPAWRKRSCATNSPIIGTFSAWKSKGIINLPEVPEELPPSSPLSSSITRKCSSEPSMRCKGSGLGTRIWSCARIEWEGVWLGRKKVVGLDANNVSFAISSRCTRRVMRARESCDLYICHYVETKNHWDLTTLLCDRQVCDQKRFIFLSFLPPCELPIATVT